MDDSREPLEYEGVKRIVLPYDSGVSAGRQSALEAVETPYVLLLDDDCWRRPHSDSTPEYIRTARREVFGQLRRSLLGHFSECDRRVSFD